MKRYILIIAIFFLSLSKVFSTEQISDRLIIGSDTFYLKSFPLEDLRFKHRLEKPPFKYGEYSFPHTACYRGYVATWRIIDEKLMLIEVEKVDSTNKKLNIIEYFENNNYTPTVIDGFLLLILTITVYKTGLVHKTRNSSGHLQKKQSIFGSIIMLIVFILIISFFAIYQIFLFNDNSTILEIITGTSILIALLLLFDSFFIDLLLIGKIKPSFLNIPAETTIKTMKIHVIKTFTIGWIFIVPIILISSLITYFVFK